MTQTSAFASLFASLIGRTVMVADKTTGAETEYKIFKLSDKLGALKKGEKAEYIVLQNSADEATVINLHPKAALTLVTKGEDAGMKLVGDAAVYTEATAPAADTTTEAAAPEAGAEAAPAADTPAAAPEVKEPKAPSKKELFMNVYRSAAATAATAGTVVVRKEVKAAAAELGLSDACFNTYYQNAHSGKWA